MIKNIKIENFKSIQSLDLELGRLNVFIGANGSGKSNILEAIAFSSAAIDNKLDNEFFASRGIRPVSPELMTSAFASKKEVNYIILNIKTEIEYSANLVIHSDGKKWIDKGNSNIWQDAVNSNEDSAILGFRKQLDFLFAQYDKAASKAGINKLNFDRLNEMKVDMDSIEKEHESIKKIYPLLSLFLIFAPENHFLRNFNEETQIRPLGVRGEGLFNHIVELFKEKPALFQKINDNLRLLDWFDGFEIPNDLMFTERRIKIKDRNLEEGLQYFDQRSANEGFLYLLFYLTLFISDETPKFFAIDNIDNAMNPKLGRKLVKVLSKLAKEHGKQAILTTHNPAILDGLNLTNQDLDQRLFVVYRDADGTTSIRRILPKKNENGATPVPLSEQFLRGYLGGLPDNF